MMDARLMDIMSRFSKATQQANTIHELDNVMTQSCFDIGIKMYSYHHLPPLGSLDYQSNDVIFRAGFPDHWEEFYKENNYLDDDPILTHIFEKNRILTLEEVLSFTPETDRETCYYEALKTLNLGGGLILPVFGPRSRSGVFTLGFQENCRLPDEIETAMMQWACQVAHYRYVDLIKKNDSLSDILTSRELEVLKWIARGKSNATIAELLNISKHTVNGYLKTIFIKLDVSDRVSASFRAVSHGLI